MNIRGTKRLSKAGKKPGTGKKNVKAASQPVPTVGVGASAAGLEAFTALLKSLPENTGMAFVLVQHMDPAHQSALRQTLSGATGMPVSEVVDGMAVEPNHIYVMPSSADTTIRGGTLRLAQRQEIAASDSDKIPLSINEITGQPQATEELRASEARYRATAEDQTELIARFLPDETITFANEAYCRYFGRKLEELIGHNFINELVAEVDREATRQFLAALSLRKPVGTFVRHMAAPGGRWRQWIIRAFFDEQGQVVEYQSAGRDVTELKDSEAALLLYQQELQALTAKLISAQEEERKHLARELHDVFSQKLAALGMGITGLEQRTLKSPKALGHRLGQIAAQIGGLAKDIHQMSRRLHPAILDELGLAAALNNECLAFSEQYGVPAEFTEQNARGPLPEDVSLCLYRVAQESLRNIGKHAGATEVRAALIGSSQEITLVIEDFGDGFDIEEVRGKGGLGLVSMDERVRLVNGTFSIQSEPGKGTRVEVRVPLRREEA